MAGIEPIASTTPMSIALLDSNEAMMPRVPSAPRASPPTTPIVAIGSLVLYIMAAVAANRGEWYRYPVNIRFVK